MNTSNSQQPSPSLPEQGPATQAAEKPNLQSGEKVFTVVLFLIGLFFLVQSIQLWMRMSPPRISSAAALPLFCSGVWTVLSLAGILENIKKSTPLTPLRGKLGEAVKNGLAYAFPKEVLVVLAAIIAYCVCLLLGISFYIATPIFLWGSMCYLMRGGYVKNILWTAICIAFIVLVFRMLFGVVLP